MTALDSDTLAPDTSAPIGSVVAFAGPANRVPPNWLICDGRRLDRTAFPALHDRIGTSWGGDGTPGFYLPDLRGQFLRGVDRAADGSDTVIHDPGRDDRPGYSPPAEPNNVGNSGNSVGSFQRAATAQPASGDFLTTGVGHHTHVDPTWNGRDGGNEVAVEGRGPGGIDYVGGASTSEAGAHSHVVTGGDAETRPVNAYVYWIIRAK